jgi:hypothetical protein
MTNFIIKQTEPQLFTVGTEDGNGNWEPYEDFATRQAAKAWILRRSFPGIDSEELEPQKIDKHYEIIMRPIWLEDSTRCRILSSLFT